MRERERVCVCERERERGGEERQKIPKARFKISFLDLILFVSRYFEENITRHYIRHFVPACAGPIGLQPFCTTSSSVASQRKIAEGTTLLHVVVTNPHRHHRPFCSSAVLYYVLY